MIYKVFVFFVRRLYNVNKKIQNYLKKNKKFLKMKLRKSLKDIWMNILPIFVKSSQDYCNSENKIEYYLPILNKFYTHKIYFTMKKQLKSNLHNSLYFK